MSTLHVCFHGAMQIDGDTCRVDAAVGGGDAVQTEASVWYVAHLCGDVGRAEQLTTDHYGSERFPRAWKGQRVVVVNSSKALAILTTRRVLSNRWNRSENQSVTCYLYGVSSKRLADQVRSDQSSRWASTYTNLPFSWEWYHSTVWVCSSGRLENRQSSSTSWPLHAVTVLLLASVADDVHCSGLVTAMRIGWVRSVRRLVRKRRSVGYADITITGTRTECAHTQRNTPT